MRYLEINATAVNDDVKRNVGYLIAFTDHVDFWIGMSYACNHMQAALVEAGATVDRIQWTTRKWVP